MNNFIPHFHFCPPEDKLKPEWCAKAVHWHWRHSGLPLNNLLRGKNIKEIEAFATGKFDITFSLKMMPRFVDEWNKKNKNNGRMQQADETDYNPVAVLPPLIDAAVAYISKQPFEVHVKCQDALAYKRKKKDLDYLKKKPVIEASMQDVYNKMGYGMVEMEGTEYSDIPHYALPFDLDPENEDQFRMFAEYIYNLAPEVAFDVILTAWAKLKNLQQIRLLNAHDQYRYAVSVVDAVDDPVTGLAGVEYVFPGDVMTDRSVLPDHSDNTVRARRVAATPMELFNRFPAEIRDEKHLEQIVNNKNDTSYDGYKGFVFSNGGTSPIHKNDFPYYNMGLIKFQVKTVDYVMVAEAETKYGPLKYYTTDTAVAKERRWKQNTICFYWLENTKYFFGIDRLSFAYRDKGNEILSGFTDSIYKSKEVSAVELSIPENKKMQICSDKIIQIIRASLPPGRKIDLAGLRNAIDGLKEFKDVFNAKTLLDMARQDNIHLVDTTGWENRRDTNREQSVIELKGGLRDELNGYLVAMQAAKQNIREYTSISSQVAGQPLPDEGLGVNNMQKAGALAGLNYVNEAIADMYNKLFNIWAVYFKKGVEAGGQTRAAIERIIGENNVQLIDKLDDLPLHQIGVEVRLGQSLEEQELFKRKVMELNAKGVINSYEEFLIFNIQSPSAAMTILGVKEAQFKKQQQAEAQANRDALIQREQQVGQNMQLQTQMQIDADLQKMQLQAQIDKEMEGYLAELGINADMFKTRFDMQKQQQRFDLQRNNKNSNMAYKSILEQQKAAGGIA